MRERTPQVVYWNHSPTPYFVERFNAVVDYGDVHLEAWFNERRESIRSWDVDETTWRFPARYIPQRRVFGWKARVPFAELRVTAPDLLVQEYDRSHLAAGFLAGSHVAQRTAFRVLPNFDTWSERAWWREVGKRFVFRAVDGAKVPGADGSRLAQRLGLPAERIFQTTQSIDVDHFAAAQKVSPAVRARIRTELGLEGCVFLYVGRLWSGKGVDDVFDAYARTAGMEHVSLILVGDGEEEQRLRERAVDLSRVHFAGFVQAGELPGLYALADVMVFPTHGDPHGLVVEEAMAAGLPTITTTAAGDIHQRLGHGEAGFVVEPGDSHGLGDRMLTLARDAGLRRKLGDQAALLAATRSHQRYAEDFSRFVHGVLGQTRRRTLAARAARLAGAGMMLATRRHAPAPFVTAGTTGIVNSSPTAVPKLIA